MFVCENECKSVCVCVCICMCVSVHVGMHAGRRYGDSRTHSIAEALTVGTERNPSSLSV